MARPTKEPPAISSVVPAVVSYAATRDLDLDALALRFDLPEDAARAERVTVGAGVLDGLLHAIAAAASQPDVALQVASRLTSRRNKLVELAARACADVSEALGRLARWAPLLHEGIEASVETADGGSASWVLKTPRRPRGVGRFVHELVLAHALLQVRAGAPQAAPSSVWFAHPRPGAIDHLERFFGTVNLAFGCEHSGFTLEGEILRQHLTGADAHAVATLAPLVDAELGTSGAGTTFASRVIARIAATLPEGAEVAAVASLMHMSPRTLQRRLGDEGTSFTAALDAARFDVARALLPDLGLTLGDIAFRLGFSDLATFSRAFRRWSGKPPGQWRRS
ncbi:MAG TPA: helix-turn-helix domain-containing protein [Polyangiaceae bacterium]|jgi:AraC-like DNA-binding protein